MKTKAVPAYRSYPQATLPKSRAFSFPAFFFTPFSTRKTTRRPVVETEKQQTVRSVKKKPPRSSRLLWRATVYLGPREGLTRRTYEGLRAPPPPYDDGYRCRLVDIIACSNNKTRRRAGGGRERNAYFMNHGAGGQPRQI